MTYRFRWVIGFGFAAAIAGGCSSSSSGTPPVAASDDASTNDSSSDGGATPVADAPASMMCDAVSLAAPPDAGAAACFACLATKCMSEVATCSTDCACAPAFACLELNSTGDSLNSGYSVCQDAVNAITNGNPAIMALTQCAPMSCNAECFGVDGG